MPYGFTYCNLKTISTVHRVGPKSKPVYFCNNFVYYQPIGANCTSFVCKFPVVYMSKKWWKLSGSRQSYCKNKQAYLFGPPCMYKFEMFSILLHWSSEMSDCECGLVTCLSWKCCWPSLAVLAPKTEGSGEGTLPGGQTWYFDPQIFH